MARSDCLAGILALLCCGCPDSSRQSDPVEAKLAASGPKAVVLYGRGSRTLAPSGAGSVDTSAYLVNVFEGLTRFDEEMLLAPGLADTWRGSRPAPWT